ncbi:sensor domain-containing diguanylate cyclase [Henriciella mobilis]|uniref:GGDEF domain-containing protein n=1 Tax=Henriciella mobilis TaxID=2305467 RepID=UPI000E6757D9|nr:sensor domain-containing diguanylate cyclase [Henriciella mobilis]RIJ13848.1 sensor domain-containing diguanylate cyclase [Henriciella mobilis]RIJ20943.1 sensor domain-containing diguanylate cyclase [Henriciella mobilis]
MSVSSARTVEGGNSDQRWEAHRLEAVAALDILDTSPEKPFDRIARLVKAALDVDTALISFIDAHRQWHKANVGMDDQQIPLQETLCRHVVKYGGPLIVQDARQDPRFAKSRLVTAEHGLRFYAGIPLKTRDGFVVGTLCAIDREPRQFPARDLDLLQDFADLVVDQLELRERAMTDELTGALSRRALYDEGGRLAALTSRHRHNLTAIAFDLDHFKSINDNYGHAAGDEVLRRVAKTVKLLVRKSDIFARVGGEEFTILLPETDRQGAAEAAEKLRKDISALRFEFDGTTVGVTASLGVAAFDASTGDIETLLTRADAALYKAKNDGRNRYAVWGTGDISVRSARRRVLKAGKVSFNNGGSSIDCTVRTLGQEGAGMDLISTADVPDEFRLIIRSDGLDASCRVTSRTRTHIEVEFR